MVKGLMSRLSGAAGFQLINVTAAPIVLTGPRPEYNLLVRCRAGGGGRGSQLINVTTAPIVLMGPRPEYNLLVRCGSSG